jgi:hypothetical protein
MFVLVTVRGALEQAVHEQHDQIVLRRGHYSTECVAGEKRFASFERGQCVDMYMARIVGTVKRVG